MASYKLHASEAADRLMKLRPGSDELPPSLLRSFVILTEALWLDLFLHDRHQIMKAVKHELGPAGRDLNFNAYADNRSLFRYDMHTLPSEISDQSIGTSTLFAAWNAAIYVAQVEDDRLGDVVADGRYLESTREVLRDRGALWFYDESYVISRRRE